MPDYLVCTDSGPLVIDVKPVRALQDRHSDWFERASVWAHRHQVSMGYSSMVHVAGGEGGSMRHDDDGRAPSGGSRVSEGWWVQDDQVAAMIDMHRLRELALVRVRQERRQLS